MSIIYSYSRPAFFESLTVGFPSAQVHTSSRKCYHRDSELAGCNFKNFLPIIVHILANKLHEKYAELTISY